MLPRISRKESTNNLLLKPQTNGNFTDEGQSTRDSFHSHSIASNEDVDGPSFDKTGLSREIPHGQIPPELNRRRAQSFARPPSKARRVTSYRQTKLCVELPSKYHTPKSLSIQEQRNGCFVNISSSKKSSPTMGYNSSQKKPSEKVVNLEKTKNNRTSQLQLNKIQSLDSINLGKSLSIDRNIFGSSVDSQRATPSPNHSTAFHDGSKAEGSISISKMSKLKNHQELNPKTHSSGSDSEDPLTSSLPVNRFRSKTPSLSQFPQKLAFSPNSSSKIQPDSQTKQKSALLSATKNYTCKTPTLSKNQQQEKYDPIVIDLLSSPEAEQPSEVIEPSATVHLRTRKKKIKPHEIKKSKKQKARIHQEVPVPIPVYYPFKCEWEGCRAELMNMEILRKHVYVAHGKKFQDRSRRCLWGRCGQAWKDSYIKDGTTTSPDSNDMATNPGPIYSTRRDWKEHMEESHLIPFSWHMGDGPCGSRLAKPSTVWHQPYLFFADGRQTTPSVASQPIEEGIVHKLNARRFHWQQGGPFGEILVPISQLHKPDLLPSHINASGDPDTMDEEEADQEVIDDFDQTMKFRNVYTKKRKQDEEEFIPSDF
ncbi:hypothetical protein HI914_07277 [Erysiphe necator]|nr:hypothetical protein HI914_07277 [Erysiphe necator]